MKNPFEISSAQTTVDDEQFELAKKRHPNPTSIKNSLSGNKPLREKVGDTLVRVKDQAMHVGSEVGPGWKWLEDRAELMVDRSGVNEVIKRIDEKTIKILSVGAGKQNIEKAIIESNPEKEIRMTGIDISDYALNRISKSEQGKTMDSVFATGESLPIKGKQIDVVTSYFGSQEFTDEQLDNMLKELIRITKSDGRILITEDMLQQECSQEEIDAIRKNKLRNLDNLKFNLHSDLEWREIFKRNDLEIVGEPKKFREDMDYREEKYAENEDQIKKEYPPQFISYTLKKKEEK